HPAAHQMAEAAGEDVARDGKLGGKVGEPARSQHRLADDQKRPPVADHLQSSGDRAVLSVESPPHAKSSCIKRPDLQDWGAWRATTAGKSRRVSYASATVVWR